MKICMAGALAGAACLLAAGCGHRNIDTMDAVKSGVVRDIGKNVNIAAMDVNVVSVSFRGSEADAVVSFAPKGGTAQQGLTMQYTMERKGDEWHIRSRAQSDLQKHAAQGEGAGAAAPMTSPLPGQMGGEGSGTNLPPGHPPLNGSTKQ